MSRVLAKVAIALCIAPLAALGFVNLRGRAGAKHSSHGGSAAVVSCRPVSAPAVSRPVAVNIPSHPNAVPVLVFHGVALHGAAHDRYTVTRRQLARLLVSLGADGYKAISASTYLRFARGKPVRLPPRPILITFDDGDLSSYCGADAILRRTGMHAVMFAIAGHLDDGCPSCLSAAQLRAMRASGRWDVAFHAGWGHVQVRAARGGIGPFYATRERQESFRGWRTRVRRDLDRGERRLARRVPGMYLRLFAVPYDDYGQEPHQDPRIRRALQRMFRRRFVVSFIQRDRPPFARRGQRGYVARFEVGSHTSAATVLSWLRAEALRLRRVRDHVAETVGGPGE